MILSPTLFLKDQTMKFSIHAMFSRRKLLGANRRKLVFLLKTHLSAEILWSKTLILQSSSLQVDITLLSTREANICVSRNRDRNGRCCVGWSDKNVALSNTCILSRLFIHSSLSFKIIYIIELASINNEYKLIIYNKNSKY
jgi:hypothetical protein